ncbi:MAG: spondin domain-containing protein, partial [Myxococcota bacterium]
DAFVAFHPQGIRLVTPDGELRTPEMVERDIMRSLASWDAGTEADEVPGVGPNQAPRQEGPNTGDDDPMSGVRLARDRTNDLAGQNAGGFIDVSIVNGEVSGDFVITITNTSDETAYPGVLTPAAWALHPGAVMFFEPGAPASPGLAMVAELGDPAMLAMELEMAGLEPDVLNMPMPAGDEQPMPGPLMPGQSYEGTISATAGAPNFSFASMIVPSNDTFAAFGPSGIQLLDANGDPRSDEDIANDIADQLRAWDAGSEDNQAGAAGVYQAPRDNAAEGGDEGNGMVRPLDDPTWAYPLPEDVIRITVTPMMP